MSKSSGVLGRPMTVRAHAKINLDLRVLGTRPDGFHELRTVFQALALHDTVECIPREGPFAIECDAAGVPLDRSNLVWRAADALWRSLRAMARSAMCSCGSRSASRCRAVSAAAVLTPRQRCSA
jgi:4-diphosphocytidyl-2C-methyl-D-erythritol kinase